MVDVELSSIWSSVSLPDLLSGEKDLFDAHMQLRTNTDGGPDFLGWLNAPEGVMARTVLAIGSAAQTIASICDTLVVVGSGAACSAAQAALAALGSGEGPEIVFAGTSLSTAAYVALCQRLQTREVCLLLASGGSVSMESGIASRAVRWLLERRYGPEAKQRVFVCAVSGSAMHQMAKEEGYTFLAQPGSLGGADSALSPAALLPMAVGGIEPLGILEGAEQAYHDYDLRAFENPAWMYAGARHALELRARRTEFLGVFEPELMPLARWWARYTAARSCRGGYGVLPVPMELPGALDTADAMLAGGKSAFETFLRIPLLSRRCNIELDWKDYDGLGFLSGHSVAEAENALFDAMVQTHAAADVPMIVLSAEKLDAPQLGELLYFFELTAALCAATDGLAPFEAGRHQPSRTQAAAALAGEG